MDAESEKGLVRKRNYEEFFTLKIFAAHELKYALVG